MADPIPQVPFVTPGDWSAAGIPDYGSFGGVGGNAPISPGYGSPYGGADVSALIGVAPGQPGATAPPPGFVGPVQPPSAPSGGGSDWFAAGSLGNLFFRSRRRIVETRLTRQLMQGARVGLDALRGYFARVPTPTITNLPSTEVLSSRLPYFAGGLGVAAGIGIGLSDWYTKLFPSFANLGRLSGNDVFPLPLGSTANRYNTFFGFGKTPAANTLADPVLAARVKRLVFEQRFNRDRQQPSPAVIELLQRNPDVRLGQRPPTLVERGQRLAELYQEPFSIGRLLSPPGWVPGGYRMIPKNSQTVVTTSAPGVSDAPSKFSLPGVIAGIGPPGPTSSSTTSSPATTSSSAVHRFPRPWAAAGIGLAAFTFLNTRSRGGGGTLAAPIALGSTITTPPATQLLPAQAPLNLAVPGFAGGYAAGYGGCSCGPRGPRRKCLERAPVAWRAGRNKGKAAGSKCVRYAQRAS